MKMFSYVVRYDFGFAPNPFHGMCTLATCKGGIRSAAKVGDWIVGTGSVERVRTGRLVSAVRISETVSFEDYWRDARFRVKRPNLQGSLIQAFGDNIYHRDTANRWIQTNSRHSKENGEPNTDHIRRDTKAPRVLIGIEFYFCGGAGPTLPPIFPHHH